MFSLIVFRSFLVIHMGVIKCLKFNANKISLTVLRLVIVLKVVNNPHIDDYR